MTHKVLVQYNVELILHFLALFHNDKNYIYFFKCCRHKFIDMKFLTATPHTSHTQSSLSSDECFEYVSNS